jgi:hypothetical protein
MKAYILLKQIPGLDSGAVFIHDEKDDVNGSSAYGCLKLAWDRGNCQQGWCGGTFIFPGQLANDRNWFKEIENPEPPKPKTRYY